MNSYNICSVPMPKYESMLISGFSDKQRKKGYSYEKDEVIEHIKQVVCEYFNIPILHFEEAVRFRYIVQARQIAMYFANKLTKCPLEQIGQQIGDKDHSTVIHSFETVNNLIETDRKFAAKVNDIEELLKLK